MSLKLKVDIVIQQKIEKERNYHFLRFLIQQKREI
jgi:hypothetical protein